MIHVLAICGTNGRHKCLERVVRFFLDQDYAGPHTLLIYNNSCHIQLLSDMHLPANKRILLVNQCVDSITSKPYNSVGAIFNDILRVAPLTSDVATHFDDDDIYLPHHISEGVKGIEKAYDQGRLAYKPFYSYYRDAYKVTKAHNTMEPSVFVDFHYLSKTGYRPGVVDYNQGWLDPLIESDKLLIDPQGVPTFIYDWSSEIPVFKISGAANTKENFDNHHKNSKDEGDHIITPILERYAQYYYSLPNFAK